MTDTGDKLIEASEQLREWLDDEGHLHAVSFTEDVVMPLARSLIAENEEQRGEIARLNLKVTTLHNGHDELGQKLIRLIAENEKLRGALKNIRNLKPLYIRPSGGKDFHGCHFIALESLYPIPRKGGRGSMPNDDHLDLVARPRTEALRRSSRSTNKGRMPADTEEE